MIRTASSGHSAPHGGRIGAASGLRQQQSGTERSAPSDDRPTSRADWSQKQETFASCPILNERIRHRQIHCRFRSIGNLRGAEPGLTGWGRRGGSGQRDRIQGRLPRGGHCGIICGVGCAVQGNLDGASSAGRRAGVRQSLIQSMAKVGLPVPVVKATSKVWRQACPLARLRCCRRAPWERRSCHKQGNAHQRDNQNRLERGPSEHDRHGLTDTNRRAPLNPKATAKPLAGLVAGWYRAHQHQQQQHPGL